MQTAPPIFVISLACATERRAAIAQRLDAFDMRYEIVDGTDGAGLDESQLKGRLRQDKAKNHYGFALRSGEIGCYLSHYHLWQRVVAEKIECALILEDDVEFAADFFTCITEIVDSEWEWEFVNLSTIIPAKICRTLHRVGNSRRFGLAPRSRSTAAAYLINLSGAEKLLAYCHEIRAPIDVLCVQWWRFGARFYYVSPPPVIQTKEHETTTGSARVNRSLLPSLLRKRERWARFWAVKRHRPKKKAAQ